MFIARMLPTKNKTRAVTSISEENEVLTKARIARFSQYVLREQAWFHSANELMVAMELLEPHIAHYWECIGTKVLDQRKDVEIPEHTLVNVHMMLAAFAIENLCKGPLAARLTPKEQEAVTKGELPKSLKTHDLLKLINQAEITLSDTDKELVGRISEAFWRGRYPSPTSHKDIGPSLRSGLDVSRIKTFLEKLRKRVGIKSASIAAEPLSNEGTASSRNR